MFPRSKRYRHKVATLLPDGQIEVDGVSFLRPFDAASAIAGKPLNGWWFFLVEQSSRRSLHDVRNDYIDTMAMDAEDDDPDDEGDDDDSERN